MPDPKVEAQLGEFLAWEKEQRRQGHTNEKVIAEQRSLRLVVERVVADRLQDRQAIARYGRRIGKLENQVALMSATSPAVADWAADPSEITGTHQFAAVQRALREHDRVSELEERFDAEEKQRRENATWWKRQGWMWAGGAVITLLVASIVGCVGYVVQHLPSPPPTKSAQ